MTVKLSDMQPGSIAIVKPAFGTEPAVRVRVVDVCEDVKNGMPGIDYEVLSSKEQAWAYLDQVERVVKF